MLSCSSVLAIYMLIVNNMPEGQTWRPTCFTEDVVSFCKLLVIGMNTAFTIDLVNKSRNAECIKINKE